MRIYVYRCAHLRAEDPDGTPEDAKMHQEDTRKTPGDTKLHKEDAKQEDAMLQEDPKLVAEIRAEVGHEFLNGTRLVTAYTVQRSMFRRAHTI